VILTVKKISGFLIDFCPSASFKWISKGKKIIGKIDYGLVIMLGVTKIDKQNDVDCLVDKLSKLRVFNDNNYKINFSIKEVSSKKIIFEIGQFGAMMKVSLINDEPFLLVLDSNHM